MFKMRKTVQSPNTRTSQAKITVPQIPNVVKTNDLCINRSMSEKENAGMLLLDFKTWITAFNILQNINNQRNKKKPRTRILKSFYQFLHYVILLDVFWKFARQSVTGVNGLESRWARASPCLPPWRHADTLFPWRHDRESLLLRVTSQKSHL